MKIGYLAAPLALSLASAAPAQPVSSSTLGDLRKLIVQLRQDAGAAAVERSAQHKLDLLIMTIANDGNGMPKPVRLPGTPAALVHPATLD